MDKPIEILNNSAIIKDMMKSVDYDFTCLVHLKFHEYQTLIDYKNETIKYYGASPRFYSKLKLINYHSDNLLNKCFILKIAKNKLIYYDENKPIWIKDVLYGTTDQISHIEKVA